MDVARELFSYRKYWASRLTPAPVLPMSRAEMDVLGWDACDVIIVTGDAYVDHPSFGMAVVGRLLEAQGFRVGIISQPDWTSTEAFKALGAPTLFFGVTAGNMDSMVNRYTADRRIRSNDAYTPDGEAGRRPDHSVVVYAQRVREAFKGVPLVIGGIEASLRRVAHFDYWSDTVRRSVLFDSKADLLVFGNGERQIVEIAHRLAKGEAITAPHRHPRHRLPAPGPAGGLGRGRLHQRGRTRPHRPTEGSLRRTRRPRQPGGACLRYRHHRERHEGGGAAKRSSSSSGARRNSTGPAPSSACRPSRPSGATRCSTPTPPGSCTWRRTPATRGRSCSATATGTSG